MEFLRTPDERFEGLEGWDFRPNYLQVDDTEGGELRVHYVDEGTGPVVLLMHGEPSWAYLYRTMIPPLVAAGYRVIVPDLIGFGRSDKPTKKSDYSYQRMVDWMRSALIDQLNLTDITLICQDWGGLIGLRLVAEHSDRFARVIVANTGMPTGDREMPAAFTAWQTFAAKTPIFPIAKIISGATTSKLTKAIKAGYNAPFPSEKYKAGARVLPALVPSSPDDPASPANRAAWESLQKFDKPFLTAFSDKDPVTKGGHRVFQKLIPGAQGQPHTTIEGGGHFLQEDKGPELAQLIIDWQA